MSGYYFDSTGELRHSWLGDKWKKHKYVDRIKLPNGKYRYIYPEDLKNRVTKEKKEIKKDKVKDTKVTGLLSRKTKMKLLFGAVGSRLIEAGRKYLYEKTNKKETKEETDSNNKEKKYKYIAKVQLPNGEWRYFYDQDELDAYYRNQGTEVEQELLEEYGLKDSVATPEEDMAEINERVRQGAEYQNNCYSCAIAYDLRRRGYDVEAIPDFDGESCVGIASCYEGGIEALRYNEKAEDASTFTKRMVDDMAAEGDGACGNIMVSWDGGGGHSMAWEVVDGEVIIRDCQWNTTYRGYEIVEELDTTLVDDEPGGVIWLRTDDKELTKDVVKYVQKNTNGNEEDEDDRVRISF